MLAIVKLFSAALVNPTLYQTFSGALCTIVPPLLLVPLSQ
jgi:hypothetical protein